MGQAETERKFIGISGKRIRDFTPLRETFPVFNEPVAKSLFDQIKLLLNVFRLLFQILVV